MQKRITLHTGFMKTGTTSLQRHVFGGLPGVALYSYADGRPFVDLALNVRRAPESDHTAARNQLVAWAAASDQPVQLFSWEGLVGGFLDDYRQFGVLTGWLKSAFPDAHILLMIRRQDDLAESYYRQALHTYHWPTVAAFLNWTLNGFGGFRAGGAANIDVRSLDFRPFVEAYERAFGADRVHVAVHEWRRSDPGRFWRVLSEAIGVPVAEPASSPQENRGYSRLSADIARALNPLIRSEHNPRGLLSPRIFDLRRLLQRGLDRLVYLDGDLIPADWRREILAIHETGNRALDERLGLGLRALGYY